METMQIPGLIPGLTEQEILELRKLLLQKDLIAEVYKEAFAGARKDLESATAAVQSDINEIKILVVQQGDRVTKLERFMYTASGVVATLMAIPAVAVVVNLLTNTGAP
jgi:hypothetical protein